MSFDRRRAALVALALALALAVACHGNADDLGPAEGPSTPPEGPCAVETATPADEGAMHVPACSPVSYRSRPPSSGSHYPLWPVFRTYDRPVPWGYLVHALEHGAVAIVYNCPDGCPDDLAQARAMIAALPPRPGCSGPPVILAPDPTLDVRFAASSWRHVLRARCFDRDRFDAFVEQHENHGRELIPDDRGEVDREQPGWCGGAP